MMPATTRVSMPRWRSWASSAVFVKAPPVGLSTRSSPGRGESWARWRSCWNPGAKRGEPGLVTLRTWTTVSPAARAHSRSSAARAMAAGASAMAATVDELVLKVDEDERAVSR